MQGMSQWMNWSLAQAGTEAGAAPASTGTPVQGVGVPGASSTPTGTTGAPAGLGGPPAGAPSGGMGPIMWLLPGMLVVMILMSWLSSRKDKKRQAELMANIKKGDRVQMMGGIIGSIVELGDTEVVLRVEEGRIRFARTAIVGLVQSRNGAASSLEAKPDAKVSV
ncbi:hypothetical protein PHYC_01883 [Phycisphaerales bacterium]|nr:hypothetical protein PHYC_01883 [Phycisphaerales bacterium]